MAAMALRTDSALGDPTRASVWAIWRCRFHHGDVADTGAAQVKRHRRPQAAGADHQGMGRKQFFLAFNADLFEQDVARVAQQLGVVHMKGPVHDRARFTALFSLRRCER
jgi:hypothetical protein